MLVGWSHLGTRPCFDVVCGVSTGALVGALAFPGPRYDGELQRRFTTTRREDIFALRPARVPLRLFLAEGIADNAPLRRMIESFATDEYFAAVAAEHARGRRFYVGTTNVDTKRFVVWDMGAVASCGTPAARALYRDVLVASSAMTGFFPPVHLGLDGDGVRYDEMHAWSSARGRGSPALLMHRARCPRAAARTRLDHSPTA
jgi:predicted acylesterase/phospholipase RssA